MIPFAGATPNVFQRAGQPQKLPSGDSQSHLIHGSFGHVSQPPNCILTGSAIFAGLTNVKKQTDRQTHKTNHATPDVATDCF